MPKWVSSCRTEGNCSPGLRSPSIMAIFRWATICSSGEIGLLGRRENSKRADGFFCVMKKYGLRSTLYRLDVQGKGYAIVILGLTNYHAQVGGRNPISQSPESEGRPGNVLPGSINKAPGRFRACGREHFCP